MLLLKLTLVPVCLALLTLAARRWGPRIGGWLAGLPIVAGPILLFLAVERGAPFAAQAATAALGAAAASIGFCLAYAWTALRHGGMVSLSAGLVTWAATVLPLGLLPQSLFVNLLAALCALLVAPRLFPRRSPEKHGPRPRYELVFRMIAGAAVVLAVTRVAAHIGPAWSGLFAVFPTLGVVLAVFSHRASGGAYAATLLRAMTFGMASLIVFFLALALLLPPLGIAPAFAASLALGLGVQWLAAGALRRDTS